MSITLEQVTKRYQAQPVVNDVSLQVAEGEFFVLLGPSGSGKSTLLRAIAGLTQVDHGSIALHGEDVTRLGPRERGVGFVFQNYALFRHLSVADNIEFALRVRRMRAAERRARRQELLKLVQLPGMDDRLPAQLSGGQQQRVAVARALAHKPQVLLLDEPFGALDARIRDDLRRTIRRVQRELGITTVLVTHDQEEAFALADRIGVMNLGRLLEAGGPQDLYARPATRFVATFLGAANLLLAQQGPDGIRFGSSPIECTGGRQAASGTREHEVVAVLRPEEVELAAASADLAASCVGSAVVEEIAFTGGLQRLRLKLLDSEGVITPPGGEVAEARIEASRPQPEQRALPLQPGDHVAVGARRLHLLPTPLSSFVVHATHEHQRAALLAHPVLATLAARMKTRVLVADRGDEHAAAGVAVLPLDAEAPARAAALLRAGANELLLLPEQQTIPQHICIHWTNPAARAGTFAVAASLLRHIPAEATCVAGAPAARRDPRRAAALRALIDARAEARATHALETHTELLADDTIDALTDHLAQRDAPLLVAGAVHAAETATLLQHCHARLPRVPVLLVYREAAA